jgi:hypothetical protein
MNVKQQVKYITNKEWSLSLNSYEKGISLLHGFKSDNETVY